MPFHFNPFPTKLSYGTMFDVFQVLMLAFIFIFCLYSLLYDNLNKKIITININKFIP